MRYWIYSKLVHAAIRPDPLTGAILTPIIQSTTFVQDSIDKYLAKGYSYSRTCNPTVKVLEEKVAILENAYGNVRILLIETYIAYPFPTNFIYS